MNNNLYTYMSEEGQLVTVRRTTDILSIPASSVIIDEGDVNIKHSSDSKNHFSDSRKELLPVTLLVSGFSGDYFRIGDGLVNEQDPDVSYYVQREKFKDLLEEIDSVEVTEHRGYSQFSSNTGMFTAGIRNRALQYALNTTSSKIFNFSAWYNYLGCNDRFREISDLMTCTEDEIVSSKFANALNKQITNRIASDLAINGNHINGDSLSLHIDDKLRTMLSQVWSQPRKSHHKFTSFFRCPDTNLCIYMRLINDASSQLTMSFEYAVSDFSEEKMKSLFSSRIIRNITTNKDLKEAVANAVKDNILAFTPQLQRLFGAKLDFIKLKNPAEVNERYLLLKDLNRLKLINTKAEIRKAYNQLKEKFKGCVYDASSAEELLSTFRLSELGNHWEEAPFFPYQFTKEEIAKFQAKLNKHISKTQVTPAAIRKEIFRKIRTIYHLTKSNKK